MAAASSSAVGVHSPQFYDDNYMDPAASTTTEYEQHPVIVIGAGAAGLAAAYELALQERPVIVLERAMRLGGNIRTVWVDGKPIDLGTLQIWNWYFNVHELCRQMNMDEKLTPTQTRLFVRSPTRSLSATTKCDLKQEYEPRMSIQSAPVMERLSMYADQGVDLTKIPPETLSFYEPRPSYPLLPPERTVKEYCQNAPTLAEQCRVTFEGYLFCNTTEVPAYTFLNTMIRNSEEVSFNGDTHVYARSMAKAIEAHRGEIRMGVHVLNVNTESRTVELTDAATHEPFQIAYSSVIMASPAGAVTVDNKLPFHMVDQVDPVSTRPEMRYTRACSLVIEIAEPLSWSPCSRHKRRKTTESKETKKEATTDEADADTSREWEFAFEHIDESKDMDFVGTYNLVKLGFTRHIGLLFLIRRASAWPLPGWSLEELKKSPTPLTDRLAGSALLTQNKVVITNIHHVEWFDHAMPGFNYPAQQAIQRMQGVGNVWYAGQWTGGHPSLEFATYTGRLAAMHVLGAHVATEFRRHWRQIDLGIAVRAQEKIHRYVSWIPYLKEQLASRLYTWVSSMFG